MINTQRRVTIFKVTGECNFSCLYCLRGKEDTTFIDIQTIDNYFRKLSKHNIKTLDNIWHGGEPLLAGVDFFKEVLEITKYYFPKSEINNSIQTNGSLISDEFINLFRGEKIKIGVSLDGPKEIHDIGRNSKNNKSKSTYDKVIGGIKKLRQNSINYGLLCLLNKNGFGKESEIYRTLKENSDYARLNLYVPSGIGLQNREKFEMQIEELGISLIRFFDIWEDESSDFRLGPFYEIVRSFFEGRSKLCEYSKNCCLEILSLSPSGDIYPCGRFNKYDGFCMGNINDESLEKILASKPELARIRRAKAIDKECAPCEYKSVCEGGCAHQSYCYESYKSKTPYCEPFKMLFGHIKNELI